MIYELQDRSKLLEGRSFGIGFSILKKINKNKFETYLPFTACKDYLNDLVYVEKTKKEFTSKIHGYNHKNQDIFDKKRYFYLGVNALNYNNSNNWNKLDECKDNLLNNANNIVSIINMLEDKINLFKSRTSFVKKDKFDVGNNEALIFKVPTFWVKYPFLISLLTLYIRCYFDITDTTIDFVNKYKCFIDSDNYMIGSIKKFFNIPNYNIINKYKYNMTITSLNSVHNAGINHWLNKNI